MFWIISIFIVGIFAGYLLRAKPALLNGIDRAAMWAVYLLLFLLGLSIGINDQVVASIGRLGYNAAVITLGAVAGSVVLSFIVGRFFFR